MTQPVVFFFLLLLIVALVVRLKKLTLAGGLLGGMLAVAVYAGAGFRGVLLLGIFFILATGATSFKKDRKLQQESRRTAGQVAANGGIAGLCGLLAFLLPQQALLFQLAMAAALSSATADTLSSELGTVWGKRFYNIKTAKPDARGLDGVISVEGTACGFAGSAIIALVQAGGVGNGKFFWVIVFAGTAGNLFDSYLGATLERQHRLSNNAVNFLNTLFAAAVALLLQAPF